MVERKVFVSVTRFAEIVGLSKRTCWKLIHQGVIPVYRVGRRTLVKITEGLAALEQVGRDKKSAERTET
jgi:excisionase family DNA binding protein